MQQWTAGELELRKSSLDRVLNQGEGAEVEDVVPIEDAGVLQAASIGELGEGEATTERLAEDDGVGCIAIAECDGEGIEAGEALRVDDLRGDEGGDRKQKDEEGELVHEWDVLLARRVRHVRG